MADALFNLSSLDGSNGFTINGINTTDSSGNSVSNAGDINGDGIDDLIIGAPSAASGAGQSYVVFGSTSGFSTTLNLSSLDGSNGFTLNGSSANFSGGSVSNAGDVNDDGIDDLIIGAEGAILGAGQSYVVFGSNSFNTSLDLSSLDGSNGFIINGINGRDSDGISDSSGKSVSNAGDINGDGINDLIIGAPSAASSAGQSYVVFGNASGFTATLDLSSLDGSNGFSINGNDADSSGTSVSNAGDVNGDSIDDLIIGAPNTGKSYVVFGRTTAFNTNLDLSSLNGSNGFAINSNTSDFFGISVSSAGDVNNDGINDLIIGAYNGASGAGQSYVVFGITTGFDAINNLSNLNSRYGFTITGINDTDLSGYSVSVAGDVNDDDIADLIIGASGALSGAGQSYVVFGSTNGFGDSLDLSSLDGSNGFAINGINGTDSSGISVSGAGDINSDGADDLIVGATGAASGAGQSYVIFGTPQLPEPLQPQVIFNLASLDGSNGFAINGINATDSSGNSVSNAGDINGDGIGDLIIGAASAGQSYVVFGSTSGFSTTLNLSSLDGSNGFTLNGSAANFSGGSVSNAGDVNDDGIDDLIIGAEGAILGAGQSYVVFGSDSFNTSLDLSSLDGSNGFIINGINDSTGDRIPDSSGKSVSSAGDVNGDGIDDLIIGASNALSGAGQSYVVFGSSSGLDASFNLSDLNGSNGFAINGNGFDFSGNSVSSAGDINGDTISDLIIGAPNTGKSYVVFGNDSGFNATLEVSSLDGSNGFAINGNGTNSLGTSVSSAGDVNGDNISDLIIGAPSAASGAGQSYVVFGSNNGFNATLEVSSLDGSNGFAITGINDTDLSGYSVSAAGDINDDEIADLIIGAPFALSDAGQSYVVFGSTNGFDSSLDLANLDPNSGFAINGINGTDSSGTSVSAAGDINGDGVDDLIVSATGAASGAGQSYVIFGTPQPEPPEPPQPQVIFNLASLDGSNGFTINGINANDSSGNSVSNAGDINGDGISDLIIGALSAASGAGQSYVVFGSTNGFNASFDLLSLDGSNGFTLNGSGANSSGGSVSSAGDVNDDGIDDLIIGAESAITGAGQSYVVFGSSNGLSASLDLSSLDGSNGFAINGINGRNSDGISDSSGKSVSSAGDVNNDGIDDLIIGASGAASGAGQSYVVFGSSDFTATLELSSLDGSNGFTINGNSIDSSGNSVSSAGDVNNDDIDDLIIGAQGTGKSYVVFGSSDFTTTLELSSLNGSNGFAINGNGTDSLGTSVSSAGDVNGDSIDDLIIGAPSAASGAGQSYVVFGSNNGFNATLEVSSLDGSNGFAITGINDTDLSGISVSTAGDVNDDDIADLIIGASGALSGAGQSYVVFGSTNGFGASLDLSNLDPNSGFAINGINGLDSDGFSDSSGTSVSAAGDINNDGADDLLVGAVGAASGAGQSYVIFGTPQLPEPPEPLQPQVIFNLASLDGSNGFTINGINTADFSGNSVSNAGDINGDGIDDLIIGAASAVSGAGQSYVVFGSTNGFNVSFDLLSLDGNNGFTLNGSATNFSGGSVSSAGDVNDDGIDDLIIGAEGAILGAGQSYVVFGSSNGLSASLDLSSLDGSNGFAINGINGRNSDGISDSSGKSVSSAGDVNGDGIDDLIIGAPSAASSAGQSYVVFGNASGFTATLNLSSLDGSNGFTINGNGTDLSGNSVSSAGDINGDTIDDLIIGIGAQDTGKSYVVFGNASGFNATLEVSSLDGSNGFAINGTDSLGTSVSSAGDINGDTIDDLIIGAPSAASGAGQSYVVFGSASSFNATLEVSSLDGSNGFAINGINDTDSSGYSVSAAGDVNDDDIADLIIGAPGAASGAGQSYVVFGSTSGFGVSLDLANLDPNSGFAINGINGLNSDGFSDSSGTSVSAAGDINGDGADDLIVGATGAASGAGQSYVIFGTPQLPEPELEPQLTNNGNDVFNIVGGNDTVTLNVAVTGGNSRLVNEFGVYAVDDATGNIDGIAPGEAGYARKALERGQVILSTLANLPNGFSNSPLNSLLEFPSDTNLRFYLVKNSTTENVLTNITPITDVLFSSPSNQRITSLDNNAFSLAWEDGSGNSTNDFQNLVVRIQPTDDLLPLGTSLQSRPQRELIDLRDVGQRVTANFVVNREAAFNDFVGFYKLADENGGIDTNNDGQADILVGQAGYAQAAMRQRVAGIDLSVNNQATATYTDTFEPGSVFAPFIIINGTPDALLDNNSNNDPAVYFSFLGANADRVDHVRQLGNNTFGFEDLAGGGDNDFNDVVVRANLSIV